MERPGVGLATIVMKLKEKEVLLGKRIGSHGEGTWAFPGGHIELFEEYVESAESISLPKLSREDLLKILELTEIQNT